MSEKKEHLKWNSKFIFQFFDIYKSYECLWDVNCEDYNKRDVREASFNRLVEHLQEEGFGVINRDQLKGKIKSLKDSFRIELNKVKKSMKSGTPAGDINHQCIYTPKLVWFNIADNFWRNTVPGRDSSSNQVDSRPNNISAEDEDAIESRSANSGSCDGPATKKQSTSKVLDSPTHGIRKRPQTKMDAPRPPKILKIVPPTRQERSEVPRQTIPIITKTDRDDQFDKFAKHVASQLREMPVRSFIILQSQIQELISTERLRIIDSEEETVFSGSDIHSSTQEGEECRVF